MKLKQKAKQKQKGEGASDPSNAGKSSASTSSPSGNKPISQLKGGVKPARSQSRGRRRSSLLNEKTGANTVQEFQAKLASLQKVDLMGGEGAR